MRIAPTVLDLIGRTPLLRLNHVTAGLTAQVVANIEYVNRGGSVKDRIAVRVVDVGEGKRAVLRADGAEVVVAPTAVGPEDPRSYSSVSDRLVREIPGAFKPNQDANPNGPAGHDASTGPEMWADTGGRSTHLVAGVGTGGRITGTGRYLKDVSGGAVRVVGAGPEGSVESFRTTLRLAREEGLLVGGSSGMAVVAALRVAERLGPDDLVVVLLPDGGRGDLGKSFDDGPVVMGEVIGAVDAHGLVDRAFSEGGDLRDAVGLLAGPRPPLIGGHESLAAARAVLSTSDALLVTAGGKPVGVLTLSDLLAFVSEGPEGAHR